MACHGACQKRGQHIEANLKCAEGRAQCFALYLHTCKRWRYLGDSLCWRYYRRAGAGIFGAPASAYMAWLMALIFYGGCLFGKKEIYTQ